MAPHADADADGASLPPKQRDAIGEAGKHGFMGATAGLIAAALQNSLAKENYGVVGVFKRTRIWVTYPGMLDFLQPGNPANVSGSQLLPWPPTDLLMRRL
jgi:hypothetical protein